MHKAVVFDIDGTLTKNISWVVLTEGVGGSIETNDYFLKECVEGRLTQNELEKEWVKNWNNGGKGNRKYFYEVLNSIPLRDDAIETIKYLQNKKYDLCLITGSFDLYGQIVSEKVGVKEWYANTALIWDKNDNLIDVKTVVDDKQRKLDHFREFCLEHKLDPKECVPIGDSSNDLGLFKLTGNGIVVRTQYEAKELESSAWKIINDLSEIKSIL
jgi:HAD superfamily phosphoserine phosphatase-like hydrolase